jgi:hypothetical protein
MFKQSAESLYFCYVQLQSLVYIRKSVGPAPPWPKLGFNKWDMSRSAGAPLQAFLSCMLSVGQQAHHLLCRSHIAKQCWTTKLLWCFKILKIESFAAGPRSNALCLGSKTPSLYSVMSKRDTKNASLLLITIGR